MQKNTANNKCRTIQPQAEPQFFFPLFYNFPIHPWCVEDAIVEHIYHFHKFKSWCEQALSNAYTPLNVRGGHLFHSLFFYLKCRNLQNVQWVSTKKPFNVRRPPAANRYLYIKEMDFNQKFKCHSEYFAHQTTFVQSIFWCARFELHRSLPFELAFVAGMRIYSEWFKFDDDKKKTKHTTQVVVKCKCGQWKNNCVLSS